MSVSLPRDLAIVCLGSAPWDYPGFQQSAMRELAKSQRVLWVNPTGTRKVSLSTSNLGRYLRKLKSLFAGTKHVAERVWVCHPFLVPMVYNPLIARLNAQLLHAQFLRQLSRLGFRDYALWVGSPMAAPFLRSFSPRLTVYNPVDRYYAFSFVDRDRLLASERDIARTADLIFCTADAIRDDLSPYNPRTYTVNHGVNFARFSPAAAPLPRPADIADLEGPILGFYGSLSDWVDYDLLREVALAHPAATVLLIGPADADLSAVQGLPNVRILPRKPHAELPSYLSAFSVGLIPYRVCERLVAVDPTKLREYLAAGKPVVTTNLPETAKHAHIVAVARDRDEFVSMVGAALAGDTPEDRARRVSFARGEDWAAKLAMMTTLMAERLDVNRAKP